MPTVSICDICFEEAGQDFAKLRIDYDVLIRIRTVFRWPDGSETSTFEGKHQPRWFDVCPRHAQKLSLALTSILYPPRKEQQ